MLRLDSTCAKKMTTSILFWEPKKLLILSAVATVAAFVIGNPIYE